MKLLDSNVFEFLVEVLKSKDYKITADNPYFNIERFVIDLNKLENSDLIEMETCYINYEAGYFEDSLLSRISKLLMKGNLSAVKKFTKAMDISELDKTFNTHYKNVAQLYKDLRKVFPKIETSVEVFSKEIDYNIEIILHKTNKLDEYIRKYLEDFRNDALEIEIRSKDDEEFFGPQLPRLRYFKQKEQLLTTLKQKLDIQLPSNVVFKLDEGYPTTELLEAFILEGYVNSYKEEDIDDGTFLGSRQLVLDVNEDKIFAYQMERKNDNNYSVKFDVIKSVLVFDKTQVKVRKFSNVYHILKYLFSRDNFYEECFYDEINDELDGQKELDNKKMYDALYQFTKERLSKENKQDFLILALQSVAINPKYKNEV